MTVQYGLILWVHVEIMKKVLMNNDADSDEFEALCMRTVFPCLVVHTDVKSLNANPNTAQLIITFDLLLIDYMTTQMFCSVDEKVNAPTVLPEKNELG